MWENLIFNITEQVEALAAHVGDWAEAHIVNILAILLGAWLVRRFGVRLITSLLRHTVRADLYPTKSDQEKRLKTLNSLTSAGVRIGVYVIAAILLIGEINPAYTTALFASAGVLGVALGFGAQSLIRDFVSGIFIITENQYRIGDDVTLVAGGGIGSISGHVEDLTIRTTVLRDLSGDVHHLPNGNIGLTTNKTLGYSRINEDITVALDTDLELLEHTILAVGEEVAALADLKSKIVEPPYLASVESLSDKGLQVKILAKTTPAAQWKVRSEFYKRLKKAVHKNHIKLGNPEK